ncbi:unnamed protein product [Trichobilharzia szidati]|nr:unnamed protein product [Trichobilharzia szidati]
MVCIPCIVIPVILWILHRLLYPVIYFFIPSLKCSQDVEREEERKDEIDEEDSGENELTDQQTPTSKEKSE